LDSDAQFSLPDHFSGLETGSKTLRMARIYPFRAWRYNPSAIRLNDVRLDDLVTQPAEAISPSMQQACYQRSPYNLIRIVLGLPELFDAGRGESVYTRAARDFGGWREQGVLVQETVPCIFAYSQRFQVPGTEAIAGGEAILERRSFIALGKLDDAVEQVVFRAEPAQPAPAAEQLALLSATHAQFGPILMLYSDPARSVEKTLFESGGPLRAPPLEAGPADAEATDEFGVVHRLWRISDPAAIRLLTAAMDDKKLILAAGASRYDAALAYAQEHTPAEPQNPTESRSMQWHPPFPAAAAMMTFVNMDSDGLAILPIHRVVHSLPKFDSVAFAVAAQAYFTVEALAEDDAAGYLQRLNSQPGTAFIAVTRAGALLLHAQPEAATAVAHLPERQRQLDLSLLHTIVLERLLGLHAAEPGTNLRLLRDASEATDQVRRHEADVAFLTRPVSLEQLREVAFAGDVLPQNSTEFFPNPISGMAIYALD
jgi:uncharacterized protein (DUF1015 family)